MAHDWQEGKGSRKVQPKRSTAKGEARDKLIAALTAHHRYANGGCLNTEPIGNNALARLADVSRSTATAFFSAEFKGHSKYKLACITPSQLAASLKLLNGEYAPYHLNEQRPSADPGRDE